MELFRYVIVENGSERGALYIYGPECLTNYYMWGVNLKWLKVPDYLYKLEAGTYEFWFKRRGARIYKARCIPYYKRWVDVRIKKSSSAKFGSSRILYEDEFQVIVKKGA